MYRCVIVMQGTDYCRDVYVHHLFFFSDFFRTGETKRFLLLKLAGACAKFYRLSPRFVAALQLKSYTFLPDVLSF